MEAISSSPSLRLFVYDPKLRVRFLIDTGSDVSLLPRSFVKRHNYIKTNITHVKLSAANGTNIKILGTLSSNITLGLPSIFNWSFFVADIDHALIGADFLSEFGLLVDLKRCRLIDANNLTSTKGSYANSTFPEVHLVVAELDPRVSKILQDCQELVKPPNFLARRKHNVRHPIETKGGPVHTKPRRLRPDILAKAKTEVEELVRLGVFRPSRSDWSSAVVIKPKTDGSLRICGDYRALNSITVKDDYPMPNIADATGNLSGAKIFSNIDLVRAYYNIHVDEADQHKTALSFPFGLYEHITMPMGLTNAPKTWQRFVNELFFDLDFVFVYLDDILIFSKNEEIHEDHLRQVFERLQHADLHINLAKCNFFKRELVFLGHKITRDGFEPTNQKLEAVEKLEPPKTIHELRSQLGLLNFYRPFIQNAATTLAPLNDLLHGHARRNDKTPIDWTEDLKKSYQAAKEGLLKYVRLAYPKPGAQLRLTTDASDLAIGGVLEQETEKGKYEPLGFFSEKLTRTQLAWSTYDKELYAIAAGIEKFEHLLEAQDFVVRTDHKPLTFLKPTQGKKRTLERRNRVIEYILQFNPKIEYIRGESNTVADSLSRLFVEPIENAPASISLQEIAEAQTNDLETIHLLRSGFRAHSIGRFLLNGVEVICTEKNGELRPIVPHPLRRRIFDSFHVMAHPGRRASTRLILQHFWWPRAESDIHKWCRSCIACQRSKTSRHTSAPLQKFPPTGKFEHVHVDLVGPLPVSNGFRYLCTFIDRWTRWPEAVPLVEIKAEDVSAAFVREWVARHGVPLYLTCDRGTQFTSEMFEEITKLLGTHVIHTTAYHPPANGALERWHRTLKTSLTCAGGNWVNTLPLVLLALRNTPRTDTNVSSSQLTYGCEPKLPNLFFTDHPIEATEPSHSYVTSLKKAMETVRPQPFHWKRKQKSFVHPALSSCSHVFIRVDRTKAPLTPAYEGPYPVLSKSDKYFLVDFGNHSNTISIDRLKSAFLPTEDIQPEPAQTATNTSCEHENTFDELPHTGALSENSIPAEPQLGENDTLHDLPRESPPLLPLSPDTVPVKRAYTKKPTLPRSLLQPQTTTRSGRTIQPPRRLVDSIETKKRVQFDLNPQIREIPRRQASLTHVCPCSLAPKLPSTLEN